MSDYNSLPSYRSNPEHKDQQQMLQNIKSQVALAQAQEIVQRMTDKCFRKCVNHPGSSLDNGEQRCLGNCMDRYMEAFNLVSQTYSKRLQQERDMGR